ncbi:MAG: ferrous iron transport protein B [Alphaproteobacteria bacterium]
MDQTAVAGGFLPGRVGVSAGDAAVPTPHNDIGDEPVITVALVGNPNCGKSKLFNRLTGARANVANYPRVTISAQSRMFRHRGHVIRLVDLPGIYSLNSQSPEECIGRDFIQDEKPDVILNILDAGNLDRSLFLTTQLIEMGRPRVYALNMIDEARRKGVRLDTRSIGSMLGGRVIETVATTGEGLPELLDAVVDVVKERRRHPRPLSTKPVHYDDHLEQAIERVQSLFLELHPGSLTLRETRWLAIKLLEGDDDMLRREGEHDHLIELVRRERYDFTRTHGDGPETFLADGRFGFINGLLAETRTFVISDAERQDATRRVDRIILHRWFGMPIFLALLWLMFEATFSLGTYPMNWLDAGVKYASAALDTVLPPGLAHDLLINGVIAGVGGTIVFLPNIVILFFFMALFSETGYLARSAFLMDRLMHPFGLHGKAFIPLVLGFDCNVPAIMAARTIESQRGRLIAVLITPFMSCSARLPVFILFAGAFFPNWAETVLFGLYLTSILVAMGAAILLGKTMVKGESESFVMELPPYRMPSVRGVLFHMGERGINFLQKVGIVVLVGSIIIWFLQEFPREVELSQDYGARIAALSQQEATATRDQAIAELESQQKQERLEKSYLGRVSISLTPVLAPLGFAWRDTTAVLTGFMAKEAVVGSYAILFVQARDAESQGLRAALAGAMTPLVAIAFMVFLLLYAPCLSTVGAIWRETQSLKWAVFSVFFSFALAWVLAFLIVKIGRIFFP